MCDDRSSTTACCYELDDEDADGRNQEDPLPTSTRAVLAETPNVDNHIVSTPTSRVTKRAKEKKVKESKTSKTPCAICYDDCKKTILAPCGHKAICKGCTQKLMGSTAHPKCPICRKGVQSYIVKEYRV